MVLFCCYWLYFVFDVNAVKYFRFDGSKPRSLIESYILDHLAPLVVGPLDVARRNGFIGIR